MELHEGLFIILSRTITDLMRSLNQNLYKQKKKTSHITLHTQFPVFWQEHTPKVTLQKVSSVPAMSQPQAEHAGYP